MRKLYCALRAEEERSYSRTARQYTQILILVNLALVKICVFSLITGLRPCFYHEPRVVTDTPGYGEAAFAIGGVKF